MRTSRRDHARVEASRNGPDLTRINAQWMLPQDVATLAVFHPCGRRLMSSHGESVGTLAAGDPAVA
jgi:hypothetical protein